MLRIFSVIHVFLLYLAVAEGSWPVVWWTSDLLCLLATRVEFR